MMKSTIKLKILGAFLAVLLVAASARPARHWDIQEVDSDGIFTSPLVTGSLPVTLEGTVLNLSSHMLDSRPAENSPGLGGMWQVYIQGEPNDHSGTAVWMGQRYVAVGGEGIYSDKDWMAEVFRVTHDPATGFEIMPGDRVRVTGLLKFFKGKVNINERHSANPANDFTVELVEPAAGLPLPELITLDMVKDNNDRFIFDPNRGCDEYGSRIPELPPGCEYYQGRLVRINGVSFASVDWRPDGSALIQDSTGRTFPVLLGRGPGFTKPIDIEPAFDIIGIMDQESSGFAVCTDGYRIWVPNYDGNGTVLGDFGRGQNHLSGDIDMDGDVDLFDLAELAVSWLLVRQPGS